MMKCVSATSPLINSTFIFILLLFICIAQAQNQTGKGTPAYEVSALNSLFSKWNIPSPTQYSSTKDPCNGAAVNDSISPEDLSFNPGIKCDCSYGTICHISQLKVYAQDVTGPIPNELWTLSFLTNLNLAQNYFTGPLSPSIGNLTHLQYLSLSINALSGKLPKELGQLTDLRSLALSINNFSGHLPAELGNLLKLEQFYFDSSGVGGPIPSTFASLQNLVVMWASDNALTGSIPPFIGSWSNLSSLRFQGNSFSGSIPLTFSNLGSLTDLRISDLSNGTSSLAFLNNMTSLNTLILRNNYISDSIPSNFEKFSSLSTLDLSFNNIMGSIPASLFNLSSLSILFLGNNKLIGLLPAKKSKSLLNIDLSYNQLSGNFPFWISQQDLEINLVVNNFTLQRLNDSVLASGLNCLQMNFPCYRNTPMSHNFSVKCGGPQITSSDGITYEHDNFMLGPASYNVSSSQKWAVSNVGSFVGRSNSQYTFTTKSYITGTGTLGSEPFQTARVSPSSLRYYGLGLENGNYVVNLRFAEIVIENSATLRSLGRRVFDIYIQGNLMTKDFDIRASFGAISLHYKARVSENYLEIHLFWAGKGTCCVPTQGTYGPLISAIDAILDSRPPAGNKSNSSLVVSIVLPVAVVGFLSIVVIYWLVQRRKWAYKKNNEDFIGMDARPYTYTYAELRSATDNFHPSNKLGQGGFGPVYKGKLNDGRVVTIKQLLVAYPHGKSQFVAEIATISSVRHQNLIKLYGCCIERDKRLLVYEYLEKKSLDQALFGNRNLILDWPTRFDICMGVARGLAYFHEESRHRIVHRDVKSSNILLDSDLNPKISDFGLAKLYDDKQTHISTRVAGTIGYLAPEYAMRGHLTEKADVFGFGVVALEIVAGRANSDQRLEEEKIYLLEWAWNLHERSREVDLVDRNLSEFNEEQLKRVIRIGLWCTQTAVERPPMSRVVMMLSGDVEISNVISRPGYLTGLNFKDSVTNFLISSDTTNGYSQYSSLNGTSNFLISSDTTNGYSQYSSLNGTSMEVHASSTESKPVLKEFTQESQ